MRQDSNNPMHGRNRICEFQHPREVRAQADYGLSVLDRMRAIRDGKIPAPPIGRLIGFHYIGAEPGEISGELQPEQSLENQAGTVGLATRAALCADPASFLASDRFVGFSILPVVLSAAPDERYCATAPQWRELDVSAQEIVSIIRRAWIPIREKLLLHSSIGIVFR